MPKIAFIGAGRMASAIIDGLIAKGVTIPSDIACIGGTGRSAQELAKRTGIVPAANLEEAVAHAELVIVAFKPQHLATADPRLARLTTDKLVVSVLAAKTLDTLRKTFPNARNIVRTMPNTPSAIGAGMTGWCSYQALLSPDRNTIVTLLQAIGRELEVPESQMDALMAISGCGPAFVFEFTAALREAGVTAGLPTATAEMLALETVLGAAKLMTQSTEAPETLRDQVTSPNGTTFAGLKKMDAGNFRGVILEAVFAAKARSEEISRGA